jgi:hypothetical protein
MLATKKRKNINLEVSDKNRKIALKLDITILNMLIGIIFKDDKLSITRKNLLNIMKLVELIDERVFDQDEALEARFKFIKRALEAKLVKGFSSIVTITGYCKSDVYQKEIDNILNNLAFYTNIKYEDIKYINKAVEDRLKYYYLFTYKDIIYECIERLDSGEYDSFEEINELMYQVVSKLLNRMRKVKTINSLNTFSLDDDNAELIIEDIVTQLKSPFRILQTPIQKLNQLLAPGFYSKRLYCFLGLPAQIGLIY